VTLNRLKATRKSNYIHFFAQRTAGIPVQVAIDGHVFGGF
jgi:hypothetical protein